MSVISVGRMARGSKFLLLYTSKLLFDRVSQKGKNVYILYGFQM
jgi:hypothetical protein